MPRAFRLQPTKAPQRIDSAWIADALNRADAILAGPPRKPHMVRVGGKGSRFARFALPLELCMPQNRTRHGQAWRMGQVKKNLLAVMMRQERARRTPLPGRPFVLCTRFSCSEPDAYADWAKAAVDRLTVKNNGLGFLRDDRPSDCEIVQRWEYAPRGHGFVVVEVWTGEQRKVARRDAGTEIRIESGGERRRA